MVDSTGPEEPPTDRDLVERAAAGERDAFAALYERHHTAIYRFARAMTGSVEMADDVTQEVFLALMRDLDRYDSRRGSVRTYLYGIARNVSRYRLRRERRFVGFGVRSATEPESGSDPSLGLLQSQTAARVRAIVRALATRYREVLVLCDIQGLSYEEASVVLRTPIGTVRSRLHRARRQLAERVVNADRLAEPVGQGARKCAI